MHCFALSNSHSYERQTTSCPERPVARLAQAEHNRVEKEPVLGGRGSPPSSASKIAVLSPQAAIVIFRFVGSCFFREHLFGTAPAGAGIYVGFHVLQLLAEREVSRVACWTSISRCRRDSGCRHHRVLKQEIAQGVRILPKGPRRAR